MSQCTPLFSMPMYTERLDLSLIPNPSDVVFNEFWDLNQSENRQILELAEWQSLRSQIDRCLGDFFHGYLRASEGIELVITDSWINRYDQGQAQPRHFHSNSVFSGVVMLCDHVSAISYYTPHRSNYRWDTTDLNLWNSTEWRMPCEQGLLIITPSTLDHQTQVNQSGHTRWSLAFDTRIQGDPKWVRSESETLDNISRFRR